MKLKLIFIFIVTCISLFAADKGKILTKSQVDALVSKEGSTEPEWLKDTSLKFPKTLDLTWNKPTGGWQPNKFTGTYFWAIIRPNPKNYKEGIKLLYHLLDVNKNNPSGIEQCYNHMAFIYSHMKDWPRAAYFAKKQKSTDDLLLAECYFKMGCIPMALKILSKYKTDSTRQGTIIKLLADIGEDKRAVQLAELKAKRTPDIAYLMAGYACRNSGDLDKASGYYQQAADANRGGRDIKLNRARAKQSFEANEKLKKLDLSKISDGKYQGTANGYRGPLKVEVEIKSGKITSVKLIQSREDRLLNCATDVPEGIVNKQGIAGVDAITSATVSSEAIMNAVANALVK